MTTEKIKDLIKKYGDSERVFGSIKYRDMDDVRAVNTAEAALLAAVESMAQELEAAKADAARIDWIEKAMFGQSWNGVMGSGSKTNWRVWEGYRHMVQKMIGNTFREAIDAAMAAPKDKP